MARPYIMPIGFVDSIVNEGVVILLTNPEESTDIRKGTPVTIRVFNQGTLSSSRMRGEINSVGYVSATVTITETRLGRRWPQGLEILRRGTPVYLGIPGTFEPDESRMLTQEQTDSMASLASLYAGLARRSGPERPRTREDSPPTNGKNGQKRYP